MTNKRGTVKLFTFSFEIDAPNIISCAPKIFSCAPTKLTSGSTSAPKLKFKLWALNSMICSDIRHKYHEWYFEPLGEWILRQFWNIMNGTYAKYHVQIMLSFVYTTAHKRFVIFTYSYFKLSWNTTALSQSNCRNFSCGSIKTVIQSYFNSSKIYSYFISLIFLQVTGHSPKSLVRR